jgi:hydroxyethylthiazole kinase-like uncharacterized protein yjeF
MLKILSTSQIKALDKATIESEPIPSIELMERASLAFVRWFVRKFDHGKTVGIVCGAANNGGDGLAIARMLKERRYQVTVWIVEGGVPQTEDFKANLNRLAGTSPIFIDKTPADGIFGSVNVLIDALFGSGLSRPLGGVHEATVAMMNKSGAVKVAVDVPSGLLSDGPSSGETFCADFTITFQLPKLAFMLPENGKYVGQWEAVDIGLSQDYIDNCDSQNLYINDQWVRAHAIKRKKFAHKGDFGKVLLIAGSEGKMGAAVLAARATLRAGAGLVTVHVPGCGCEILQSSVPEAMVIIDKKETHVTDIGNVDGFDCIGIGPGLGKEKATVKAIKQALKSGKPLVIDADAINLISENKQLIKSLHTSTVLTPHPGEFRRLAGKWSNDFERLELQRKLSVQTGSTIVLKGAHTTTTTPDGKAYFNSTGNPGMATGGSGDVLTGLLTGLLAQGLDPGTASVLGVYLHGKAGDLAAARLGPHALIASDIVDMIPASFRSSFS